MAAGGVTTSELAAEFDRMKAVAGLDVDGSFYELRHAVKTELRAVGVSEAVRHYVSDHSLDKIEDAYTSLDVALVCRELQRYWEFAAELLTAIVDRARFLGIDHEQ